MTYMPLSGMIRCAVPAAVFALAVLPAFAQAVLPGYLTDPSVVKGVL